MRRDKTKPLTGSEYLESLKDGREIWLYGERVKDVTSHPGFRNSARSIARLYDALHAPETRETLTCKTDTNSGGVTHRFFKASRSSQELFEAKEAITTWCRMTYGFVGRLPDYKASFLGTLQANSDFLAPYSKNALRIYKEAQERVWFFNHAIVNPPIDRHSSPDQIADIVVHVEKETDRGLVVSGAKTVATGSALTHFTFIAQAGEFHTSLKKPEFAVSFIVPVSTPGVKLICRPSYEMAAATMGSPFDYPLASRFDENDAVLILDKALIPWENVLIYGDIEKFHSFLGLSGFIPRSALHGCVRFATKLDFLSGLLLKGIDASGTKDFRNIQIAAGEVLAWSNLFWAIATAQCAQPTLGPKGTVLPNMRYGVAYMNFAHLALSRVKEIIEQTLASGLIYVNSHATDFETPDLRKYLEKFYRGSNGYDAVSRIKLFKLMWDAIGSEFAGRSELYERNWAGSHDGMKLVAFGHAAGSGLGDFYKQFAEQCLNEYNLQGWTIPDLVNPGNVSIHKKKSLPKTKLKRSK